MTNKIGKKRKITFWTRLGFGMGGMLNSGALTFTHTATWCCSCPRSAACPQARLR